MWHNNKFKESHALIIIVMSFLFECVDSNTFQLVAKKADKCIDTERNALLDLKAMITRDPQGCISAWGAKKEDDCCKWHGVTCNSQLAGHHVTELNLFACGLEGEISRPSLLLNLTSLTHLGLSYNSFKGSIPESIGSSLTKLTHLDLSFNSFSGTIPESIGNLTELRVLSLTRNSFSGTIPRSIGYLTKLTNLFLTGNSFSGTILGSIGNLTGLTELDLTGNSFNGTIPKSVGNLTKLIFLDLGNNSFSGNIPPEFGNLVNLVYLRLDGLGRSCSVGNISWLSRLSRLHYLNMNWISLAKANHWVNAILSLQSLTYLRLHGCDLSKVMRPYSSSSSSSSSHANSSSNMVELSLKDNNLNSSMFPWLYPLTSSTRLERLDLSGNSFSGKATDLLSAANISSTLKVLNLSKNKFYGGISFLCQIVDGSLSYLDLSLNSFSGQIPDCLWHLKELQLEVLNLYNNNFSGELPLSLRNCTKLTFLDLGANKFSGNLPVWIGESLLGLYVLSLGSNHFFGPIPLQFCQLVNLQILDLSMNNLNGTIPSCVNHLTSMVQERSLLAHDDIHYTSYGSWSYADHAMVQWQGIRREFTNNIGLLKSIDLSRNNITGEIPNEITDLRGLLALNLSRNTLFGEIPQKIGQVKQLLTLDLSSNHFSGGIPSSISEMTSLNYLDLSYNNLSGKIPTGTQLRTFEASSYTGNAGLCGIPLPKDCPRDQELPSPVGEREGGAEGDIDELDRWFYIGGAVGFGIGFWIVCITLLVNRRGRHTFFHFLDILEDWVYMKVLVFKAKFQREAHN